MSSKIENQRRLAILVTLSLATRYKRPINALREDLDAAGYPASLTVVRADVAFLAESQLLEFDQANDTAAATARGLDVAQGYSEAPGVSKPGPG